MDTFEMPERPAASPTPPQTVIIERAEKKGCLRRIVLPVLIVGIVVFLVMQVVTRDAGLLPSKLAERYVAGDVSISGSKIAIVQVEGLIMGEAVEHALKQIRQARDDQDVKAVVVRVDTPGGTVAGSDQIWREISMLKGRKPVVVSMGGMAASGGYWISAPGDAIYAEPTTLTGSIGVISEFPQVEGLLEKLGVQVSTIASGKWKDSGSYFRPMTDEERKRWQEVLDHTYQRFLRVVAQGRNLTLQDVNAAADGKILTAQEALRLKLVNSIGYLDDAIADAKERAQLTKARVIRYSKPINLRDVLLGITAPHTGPFDNETLLRLQVPQILLLAH
jgi:protease IV